MSSRQPRYPNNRPATPFSRNTRLTPSMAPTSPSMYSQASLPRESYMFPTQDLNMNTEHWSRAVPIELSNSSGDGNIATSSRCERSSITRRDATSSFANTKPPLPDRNGEDALMGGNNAISAPKRLSRKPAADSGTHSRRQEGGRGRVMPVLVPEPVSVHSSPRSTGTTATIIPKRWRVDFPTPENIPPRPPPSLEQTEPMPLPAHLVESLKGRLAAQAAVSNAGLTSGTSTHVDSDLAAVAYPPFSEYTLPTAPPRNMRCMTQNCQFGEHGHPPPVAQGSGISASDTVINRSAPMLESKMENGVPRWRQWEVRRPGMVDRFPERRRAASLTDHKRQPGTAGKAPAENPLHHDHFKYRSASVRSLPARIEQSAISLSNISEKKKGLKSRFASIFSRGPVSTPNLNESLPSASTETVSRPLGHARTRTSSSLSFSLSRFPLFSRRKQNSSVEDISDSYVVISHPNSIRNASGGGRTPTPSRRAESLSDQHQNRRGPRPRERPVPF